MKVFVGAAGVSLGQHRRNACAADRREKLNLKFSYYSLWERNFV